MGVGLGPPVLGHAPMHIEVGDHALIDELGLHEIAGEFDALRLGHLARKGELDLAGKLRVLPPSKASTSFHSRSRSRHRFRRILRQHDLGMDDAALVGEVVAALKPVVAQPRGRAVGGGRHRAAAGLAADDLDVKMIDRHRDPDHHHGEAHVGTTYKRALETNFSGLTRAVSARPGNITAFAPGAQLSSSPSTTYGGHDAQATGLRCGTEGAGRQGARPEEPARCSSLASWSSPPAPTPSAPTNWRAR